MVARKRRKKKLTGPPPNPRGRKKELKKFELEIVDSDSEHGMDLNEVAFLVRTSGGSSLTGRDTKKVADMIRLELRRLGHTPNRKGKPLDPPAKTEELSEAAVAEIAASTATEAPIAENSMATDSAPDSVAPALFIPRAISAPADPDDSTRNTPTEE